MLRLLILVMFAAAGSAAKAEAPQVVVTIKPVHALVSGVMAGLGEPRLLVPPLASEHAFSLKPTDARALQEANVVFWIGPALEGFLAKPLTTLAAGAQLVELAALPGMSLAPLREGGAWESHAHDRAHPGAARAPALAEADMHLWLDVENAGRIAEAAAARLSAVDPANGARYAANLAALKRDLAALDAELREALAPVRHAPFIVFHDAYQYLERRYGLNAVGSVTISPERKPSAKRLREIRRKIVERGAVCVFSEPQFDAGLVRTVVEGTPARTAALDHLGAGQPGGAAGYVGMMRTLGRALAGCLAGSG